VTGGPGPAGRADDALVARYDRDADRYGHHWAPVLDASARGLLDRVDREVRLPDGATVVDIGTGTGVLALDALRRWPRARMIATDASAGMLRQARHRAGREGFGDEPRLRFLHAPASALPLADASADLVVSSFVYQLVPDRGAALTEARRVLRPGGALALVTWLDRGDDYPPAIEFDEAVYDLGIDEGEPDETDEVRAGDFRSPRAAARELRAAGFHRVAARDEVLVHAWTPEAYLAFKREYEEDELFASLDAATAAALLARVRERFAALPAHAFTWRADTVSVIARRPG
jgi:SAM-dependent methyltransferase